MIELLALMCRLCSAYVASSSSSNFDPKFVFMKDANERRGFLYKLELYDQASSNVYIKRNVKTPVKSALYIYIYRSVKSHMVGSVEAADRELTYSDLKLVEGVDLALAEALIRNRMDIMMDHRNHYERC